ncbi:3-deoxy-7-phosphoheptulonate synthase [Buchnera aphidicola]|uniref:3-deoxy-7-phosphoheptulonate synthase n=1 Tax=Buchnera aphidicola TaxID=9 RepID=UPI0022371E4B|nr:3-deoxy-7-phosphoheptulonate synthase [Buchnera aphidicola]MCW5197626.1 3-deoxy-7-phosphoheptulonate synthase [Buchnera aphidicola (Chaitophorus viminalis)]
MKKTDELRTVKLDPLITPAHLSERYPVTSQIMDNVIKTRKNIENIISGKDKRLLVIIGPCSLHDPIAAIDYANKLNDLRKKYSNSLEIIMRTYFEKPRTVIGWKGLISDPDIDNTFKVNKGLRLARKLLLEINKIGLPAATEFLDMVIGQFINDLISWGAIGARTTESQIHREMASALSCPVGFKNGTDGNILIAIDAIRATKVPHIFLAPDKNGHMTINHTTGNSLSHIIMRGGKNPNYHLEDINLAVSYLKEFKLPEKVMIDFSHGNCLKQHKLQLNVCKSVCKQLRNGSKNIFGVMIESFLVEGSQPIKKINKMKYGQSITDSCLNWEDSVFIIKELSRAVLKNL